MKPKSTLYVEQHDLGDMKVNYVVVRTINTTDPKIGDLLTPLMVRHEMQRGVTIHIKAARYQALLVSSPERAGIQSSLLFPRGVTTNGEIQCHLIS